MDNIYFSPEHSRGQEVVMSVLEEEGNMHFFNLI